MTERLVRILSRKHSKLLLLVSSYQASVALPSNGIKRANWSYGPLAYGPVDKGVQAAGAGWFTAACSPRSAGSRARRKRGMIGLVRTVVAFHAHPDDEALLTGGTLAKL